MKRKEKIVKKVFIVALVLLLVSAPLTGCSTSNEASNTTSNSKASTSAGEATSKTDHEVCVGFYTIVRDETRKLVAKMIKQYPSAEKSFSSLENLYSDEVIDSSCKAYGNTVNHGEMADYLKNTLAGVKTAFDSYETTAPAIWSDVKNFYKALQEYIDSL